MSRLYDMYPFLNGTEQPTVEAMGDLFTMDETNNVDYSSSDLTNSQEIILYLLQIFSGTLSLIGSSTILFKIFRNLRRGNHTTPYDRLILGLSICDVISSLTYAMGPFLLPRDTSKRVWALGNDSTCTFLGFFNQLGCWWAIWYNCLLSFYYLLTVRFQVKKQDFRQKYELFFHLTGAVLFPLTATIGFFGDWYEEERYSMTCWIGEVPKGCSSEDCWGGVIVAYIYGAVPSIITLLSVIINNIVIYMFVRRLLVSTPPKTPIHESRDDSPSSARLPTEQQLANDHQNPKNGVNVNAGIESNAIISRVDRSSAKRLTKKQRLAQEAATQCCLYVSTFLLTFAASSIIAVMEGSVPNGKEDLRKIYPLLVLNSMLLPLQGFFNVFIYVKPSYDRFRTVSPQKSMWSILKQALFETSIPRISELSSTLSEFPSAEKKYSEMKKQGGSNFSISLDDIMEGNNEEDVESEMDDLSEKDTEMDLRKDTEKTVPD